MQLWRSRWGSEGEPVAVALPEIELGPMDGWESPWPSEQGALRIAAMLEAEVSEDGKTFTAAGLSATLGEEWLPPWGLGGLVVVWEQGESGWIHGRGLSLVAARGVVALRFAATLVWPDTILVVSFVDGRRDPLSPGTPCCRPIALDPH
jgi:hypothetical protein